MILCFQKSKTLYGLHLANRTIRERNCAVIVEGYTDVVACHQAGLTNVVATLGTSLTKDHATILSRICDEVILVFDGIKLNCVSTIYCQRKLVKLYQRQWQEYYS